jgi:hypothetical protein
MSDMSFYPQSAAMGFESVDPQAAQISYSTGDYVTIRTPPSISAPVFRVSSQITQEDQSSSVYQYTPPAETPSTPIRERDGPDGHKIIIKNLPRQTSSRDVESLIHKHIGKLKTASGIPLDNELESIDIGQLEKKSSRGNVFATFQSHDGAKSVAKSLNGERYHGRNLQAGLLKGKKDSNDSPSSVSVVTPMVVNGSSSAMPTYSPR